jgi:DNA-binding Lrp family transcriptional regulator
MEGEGQMVTAFVLINARRDRVQETAESLNGFEGVTEVYSVAGDFDLIAVIRAKTNEQLADLITGSMLKLPGIERTRTVIAFRSYSKFDLESMFSIGMK